MQYGRVDMRHNQAVGMGQPCRQRQCIVDSSQRLIRVPEQPRAPGADRSRANPRIMAVDLRMQPVLVKVVKTAALLAVVLGRRRSPPEEVSRPAGMLGFQPEPDIVVLASRDRR